MRPVRQYHRRLELDIKSWGRPPLRSEDIPSSSSFYRCAGLLSLNFSSILKQPTSLKMPGGGVMPVRGTTNVERVEAPVTVRAYLIVAFAAFGGIFFGYDTGWMGGVLNMDYFIKQYTGKEYPDIMFPDIDPKSDIIKTYRNEQFSVSSRDQSLVTSILSAVSQPHYNHSHSIH
jgi:hypothetical protein